MIEIMFIETDLYLDEFATIHTEQTQAATGATDDAVTLHDLPLHLVNAYLYGPDGAYTQQQREKSAKSTQTTTNTSEPSQQEKQVSSWDDHAYTTTVPTSHTMSRTTSEPGLGIQLTSFSMPNISRMEEDEVEDERTTSHLFSTSATGSLREKARLTRPRSMITSDLDMSLTSSLHQRSATTTSNIIGRSRSLRLSRFAAAVNVFPTRKTSENAATSSSTASTSDQDPDTSNSHTSLFGRRSTRHHKRMVASAAAFSSAVAARLKPNFSRN
jgi:hypothetical protein